MGGRRRCREWMRERKIRKEGAERANGKDTGQRQVSHRKRPRDYGMRRGMSDAARCEAQRSTLQQPMQRAAMASAPHCVSKPEELPWDEEHRKQPHAPAPPLRRTLIACLPDATSISALFPAHSHRATWAYSRQRTEKGNAAALLPISIVLRLLSQSVGFRRQYHCVSRGQHAILAESDHPDLSYQPTMLAGAVGFARGINLLPRGCNRIYSARHRR